MFCLDPDRRTSNFINMLALDAGTETFTPNTSNTIVSNFFNVNIAVSCETFKSVFQDMTKVATLRCQR